MKGFSTNTIIDKQFGWCSAEITDTGKVRKVNEDSCSTNLKQAHWVVADGMGGHQAGDLASQMIVSNLQALEQSNDLSNFVDRIEDTLNGVNSNLFQLAQSRNTVIGSTVVGALLHQQHMVVYWAGDSRVYLLRNKRLVQLTTDHTLVQELVDEQKISAEQAKSHPEKNVITRAVGSSENLILDFYMLPIESGDLFIVCSDGIEKELSDDELCQLLVDENDVETSARKVVDEVLNRGARDNVTLILIQPVSLCDVTKQ